MKGREIDIWDSDTVGRDQQVLGVGWGRWVVRV